MIELGLDLVTTSQAAAMLGISPRRVRYLAAARSLGMRVGRDLLLSPADIAAMCDRPPGRPPGRRRDRLEEAASDGMD